MNKVCRYEEKWVEYDLSGVCFICGKTLPQNCGYVYQWGDRLTGKSGKAHRKCAEDVTVEAPYPYQYRFGRDICNVFESTDGVAARIQYPGGHRFWGFSKSPFEDVRCVGNEKTVWASKEKADWLDAQGKGMRLA